MLLVLQGRTKSKPTPSLKNPKKWACYSESKNSKKMLCYSDSKNPKKMLCYSDSKNPKKMLCYAVMRKRRVQRRTRANAEQV